ARMRKLLTITRQRRCESCGLPRVKGHRCDPRSSARVVLSGSGDGALRFGESDGAPHADGTPETAPRLGPRTWMLLSEENLAEESRGEVGKILPMAVYSNSAGLKPARFAPRGRKRFWPRSLETRTRKAVIPGKGHDHRLAEMA